MKPEEKIAELVAHIANEFPDGCSGVRCADCPVDDAEPGTLENAVCELLGGIEARREWADLIG